MPRFLLALFMYKLPPGTSTVSSSLHLEGHRGFVNHLYKAAMTRLIHYIYLVRNVLSWKQHTDFRPPVRTRNATEFSKRGSKSEEGNSGNQEDSQEKHEKTSDPRKLDAHPLRSLLESVETPRPVSSSIRGV